MYFSKPNKALQILQQLSSLCPEDQPSLEISSLIETAIQDQGIKDQMDREDSFNDIVQSMLQDCDWTQLADTAAPIADQNAWASYRQALRDLIPPQSEQEYSEYVWPNPPA